MSNLSINIWLQQYLANRYQIKYNKPNSKIIGRKSCPKFYDAECFEVL